MALRGTLKDFGIADIFQLIGHQGKTGTLTVRDRDREVQIVFVDGSIVRAESTTRRERDLLGRMLVRAELVTEDQLQQALSLQKQTGKRVGELLIEAGALEAATLKQFTRLQTNETIYQLFLWNGGTYEFNQAHVQMPPGAEVIRSESVLMEGFRQVDEWPLIRKRIAGYATTFKRLQDLDQLAAAAPAPETDSLDDVFDNLGAAPKGDPRLKDIGSNERLVYRLIQTGRDVQKLIDLSRLGEFETCKALCALIDAHVIATEDAKTKTATTKTAAVGASGERRGPGVGPVIARVLLVGGLVAGTVYGARVAGPLAKSLLTRQAPSGFVSQEWRDALARNHEVRVRRAVELYAAEQGRLPDTLDAVVAAGLLTARDRQFPWTQPYHYAVRDGSFELLRPLY